MSRLVTLRASTTRASVAVAAALGATVGAALISSETPAVAGALTTRCVGVAADVTVPSDLIVPGGASCFLSGVRIEGSVRVGAGADLVLDLGSTVAGGVTAGPGAFVDVTESSVGGSFVGRAMFGAAVESASLGGDVRFSRSTTDGGGPGLVSIESSDIAGSLRVRTGEVSVESSDVAGDVLSQGAVFFDLVDSTVDGRFRIVDTEFGTFVCASEIYGDALVRGNSFGVQIGGGGGLGACDAASYWAGDVVIRDNDATEIGVVVSDNIVAGSLGGSGNSPAPVGAGNRVRGTTSGQFVDLAAPGAPDEEAVPDDGGDPAPSSDLIAARQAVIDELVTAASSPPGEDAASASTAELVDLDVSAPAESVLDDRRAAAVAAATAAGAADL